MTATGGLNPRQAAFVQEYLVDRNATQAAIRAGYSARTAYSCGQRLLKHAEVAAQIEQRGEELAAKLDVTTERILRELAAIAFSNLAEVAEWEERNVRLFPSTELAPEVSATIKEVVATIHTTDDGGVTQRVHVRQHDKLRALELLGKYAGMFRERVDVNVSGGITLSVLARIGRPPDDDIDTVDGEAVEEQAAALEQ